MGDIKLLFRGGGLKLYDVLIVGGGPVGSYVAYKLAGKGYGVAVVEQKKRLGEQACCTGIIGQECVSSFTVADNVILRRVNSAKLFSPSGRWLRLWREQTQACIIDRAAFDMAMASQAQDKGAEYLIDSFAADLEIRDSRVRAEIVHQGERLNLEARAVVIATGFGSRLAAKLGLGEVSDFVIGAQAEVETIFL